MGDANLLERILDGVEDPTNLSLQLLRDITENFSPDRKIGQGGFGEVYKGVLGQRFVAVKRIYITENTVDDRLFRREVGTLWNTNHRNVVRILGVCSEGYHKLGEKDGSGNLIWASVLDRLLCFEYISNGSLDKHITDELRGLEWETRYEIIIGICKGLRYLHEEKKITHMDLKPANILLHTQHEKYMVPKITDFGLSRLHKESHTVGKRYGTRGYMAPEYEEHGNTTPACDIYSLGAIIIELVTGCKDVPNKDNVLRRWRHRWEKPPTQLQYQQVTRCVDIAGCCRKQDPKERPSISKILSFLGESESTHGKIFPCLDEDDMLRIHPLELLLPSELKNEISHSVELTNDTLNCIAFNIQPPSARPVKGIVQPGSTYVVTITMQTHDEHDHVDKFTVQSMKWTEGLGQEDIIECMSRAVAHKFVDEVDLMVVYETMKPQENCKRRGHTNMLAEDVPKAKKREIGESSSRKAKNAEDITSSNLHPLQRFSRHYPTETKYLEKESDRAVDHTRGALGSLLHKLGKLVTDEYSLETSINADIKYFSEDLTIILRDLPELENVKGAKIWFDDVRELSYHIEDMVDSFLVRVEPNSNGIGFTELTHEGLKLWENGMMNHHQIGDVIRDIKNQVQALVHRKKKYNFNVNNSVANATDKAAIQDLRISAINIGIEQLIGIEAQRDEVIHLFEDDGNISKQNFKIVSIVGLGGLGKTTLAKAVYEKLSKAKNYSRAFVPVGQNPVMKEILKNIISAFESDFKAENLQLWQLIEKLQNILENKRYLIFIDDIWECSDWESIRSAFPENKCGSRVITTTRNHDVALACRYPENKYVYSIKPLSKEDSKKLFFRRACRLENDCPNALKDISVAILKTCGGMPLAINSIASLLRGKEHTTWEYVGKSLGALTEGKTGCESMKQILDLSYIHLPHHLKTCLLYICMYREDEEIYKNDLLRQWVAEGFVVSKNAKLDAEDVAEKYFKELISMCMIQPSRIDYNDEVLSCTIHDIILDLIRSKSSEEKFIHVIDGLKDVSGKIRRASVLYNDKQDSGILKTMKESLSHARSVFLYQHLHLPHFLKYKYVRVLHLEDKACYKDLDLTGISRLFLLRYLKIACNRGSRSELKLPDQIGQLQQLETIDLEDVKLKNYPSDIVTLPRLSHLSLYPRIMLPYGIERLKSLRSLEGVYVGKCSIGTIKCLGELTNLRNLCISSDFSSESEEVEESARLNALYSSISRLSTSLRILTWSATFPQKHDMRRWSRTLFPEGSHIGKLHLSGRAFQRFPEWIGQLHNLYSLSIQVREVAVCVTIAERLPFLAYFRLEIDYMLEQEESVVISGSSRAFKALKHLNFSCPKASLTFEEGALPKLENLQIEFNHHRYRRFLPAVGIEHLPAPTVKNITLRVCTVEDVNNWECMVAIRGSLPPNTPGSQSLEAYFGLQQLADNLRKQLKTLDYLMKRAFKEHHPGAKISIEFRDHFYTNNDDEAECCNEEAVEGALMHMCLPRSLQLCQLTSVQLSTLMNILYTKGELEVGSEWQQRDRTDDLKLLLWSELSSQVQDSESSQLPCIGLKQATSELNQDPNEHDDEDFVWINDALIELMKRQAPNS